MKKIVLCDSGGNEKIVELCKKYNLSINLDLFSDISYLVNNPNGIEEQKNLNKEMDIFSLHGYFHDLCFGSKDILIKEVTMKRFNESYNISQWILSWNQLSTVLDRKIKSLLERIFKRQRYGDNILY